MFFRTASWTGKEAPSEEWRSYWLLYQCRNFIGKSWDLPPRANRWIYIAIVIPIIAYGCVVWWSALDKNFQRKTSTTTSTDNIIGLPHWVSPDWGGVVFMLLLILYSDWLRLIWTYYAVRNGVVLQGQEGTRVFRKDLGLELYFRLKDDYSVFQVEIFAILRAVGVIVATPTSDSIF